MILAGVEWGCLLGSRVSLLIAALGALAFPAQAQSPVEMALSATPRIIPSGDSATLLATVLSDVGHPTGSVDFFRRNREIASAELIPLRPGQGVVSVGLLHACAVLRDGGIDCWGSGGSHMGNGTTRSALSVPEPVIGLPGPMRQVTAGNYHTCAVSDNGAAWCWGGNSHGELGHDLPPGYVASSVPVPVTGLQSGVAQIAVRGWSSCAVTDAGQVLCWGWNVNGQLGNGTLDSTEVPLPVVGLNDRVLDVQVGSGASCALTENTGIWCWGSGHRGLLGPTVTEISLVPVQIPGTQEAVALSLSADHACFLSAYGRVWCWGANEDAQLGDGTRIDRNVPVQVSRMRRVTSISASLTYSCATQENGRLYCWGTARVGQFGDGADTRYSPPVRVPVPRRRHLWSVSGGPYFGCAQTVEGFLFCWGTNTSGQLGRGTETSGWHPPGAVLGGNFSFGRASAYARVSVGADWWPRRHRLSAQ